MTAGPQDGLVAQWWATAVSRVEPGIIELREHPIQDLIGHATFVATIWLLLRGELPVPSRPGSWKQHWWQASTTDRRRPRSPPPEWPPPAVWGSTAPWPPG